MKTQLMSMLFLIVGAYGGYQLGAAQSSPLVSVDDSPSEYKEKYLALQDKFQSLSDNQIESYINETDPSLKTKKANEMLAKLLKLFLVDVGLRLEEQSQRLESSKNIQPKAPVKAFAAEVRKKIEPKKSCLLYTSPSPRDQRGSRMPSSA